MPEEKEKSTQNNQEYGENQPAFRKEGEENQGGSHKNQRSLKNTFLASAEEILQEKSHPGSGDEDRPEAAHVPPTLERAVEKETPDPTKKATPITRRMSDQRSCIR
jgi:hypothetical protein